MQAQDEHRRRREAERIKEWIWLRESPRFSIPGDGKNKNSKLTLQFPARVKEGKWYY